MNSVVGSGNRTLASTQRKHNERPLGQKPHDHMTDTHASQECYSSDRRIITATFKGTNPGAHQIRCLIDFNERVTTIVSVKLEEEMLTSGICMILANVVVVVTAVWVTESQSIADRQTREKAEDAYSEMRCHSCSQLF